MTLDPSPISAGYTPLAVWSSTLSIVTGAESLLIAKGGASHHSPASHFLRPQLGAVALCPPFVPAFAFLHRDRIHPTTRVRDIAGRED